MSRHRLASAVLLGLLSAGMCLFSAGAAPAEEGKTSLGGNFGVGLYSNSNLNDDLQLSGFDKISSGTEFGGSIRHQVGPKVSLDLEVARLYGSSKATFSGVTEKISASGLPIVANVYLDLGSSPGSIFRAFFGAGPLLTGKIKDRAESTSASLEVQDSKTSFYAQGGFEGEYRVSSGFALSARALGRIAKVSNLTLAYGDITGDPADNKTEDLDFGGAAFTLGARLYFGAK